MTQKFDRLAHLGNQRRYQNADWLIFPLCTLMLTISHHVITISHSREEVDRNSEGSLQNLLVNYHLSFYRLNLTCTHMTRHLIA